MKRLPPILIALTLTLLSAGCSTSNIFMSQIRAMKQADLQAWIAISGNPDNPDPLGQQCVARIVIDKPIIDEVFGAMHPGPLSTIAYLRSIDLLAEKLYPELERDCGPVVMDIKTRALHLR